jgi:hypothetical protein
MEELLYKRVIEILSRLETKVDTIDERTKRIEEQMTEDAYQRYAGGVR